MYNRVLIALDLEGVNNVVGEPYLGLSAASEQWEIARRQGAKEVNAAAEALFDAGVKRVAVWDNHGGGGNIDPADLDGRIELIVAPKGEPRMRFAEGQFDCICFFGYHTMEGTLGGVLAHTMNSKMVQHYKLNGKYIGEVDMDAYIAASLGMPTVFFAGGDIACRQAKRAVDGIVTVETKKEISRNEAVFKDNAELFADIKREIVRAVSKDALPYELEFPCTLEKSYKRVEDAAKYFERLRDRGLSAYYADDEILGKDAHTVISTVNSIDEFIKAI